MENPCSEIHIPGLGNMPAFEPGEIQKPRQRTLRGDTLWEGNLTTIVYDDEEGEVYIKQTQALRNPQISFGPLSTTLVSLMNDGYWLEARVGRSEQRRHSPKRVKIYLTNGHVRYKVTSAHWSDIQECARIGGQYDLADQITLGVNVLRACSSMPRTVEKIVRVERDPFDVIQERYGKPKKRAAGGADMTLPRSNMTLREEVRHQLTGKTPDQL